MFVCSILDMILSFSWHLTVREGDFSAAAAAAVGCDIYRERNIQPSYRI